MKQFWGYYTFAKGSEIVGIYVCAIMRNEGQLRLLKYFTNKILSDSP